jgi:hypothetical protein
MRYLGEIRLLTAAEIASLPKKGLFNFELVKGTVQTGERANIYWKVFQCLGRVMKIDAGKRCYLVTSDDGSNTFVQVENNEQRDKRLGK